MKILVLSLGGSVILAEKAKPSFLIKFRSILKSHYKKYKFVIVCGGGSVARTYENVLQKEHRNEKEVSLAGIRATRMNAEFIMQLFGKKEANDNLPLNEKEVKEALEKNNVVVCGALRYAEKETSDGTSAKLAAYLKSQFINITNVSGLYTADPSKVKKASLIPYISWKDFNNLAKKIKFRPGQHFVLDQAAASRIKNNRIITYIIGRDIKNLNNLLKNKKFIGTTIGP